MAEIILKKNMKNLGKQHSLVKVKDGYANYLISQGIALSATQANKNNLAEMKRQAEEKEAKQLRQLKELGKKIDSIQLVFTEKVDENGKLFGTITPSKIAEAYKKHNITIDSKHITISTPIKEVGMHQAKFVRKTLEKTIHLDVRSNA